MIDRPLFAARLQAALEEQALTYEEAARRAREHLPPNSRLSGVSIWQYANGKAFPRRHGHLRAIVKALHLDVDDLGLPTTAALDQVVAGSGDSRVRVEDLGNGRASLLITTEVAWPTAVKILSFLTDEPGSDE